MQKATEKREAALALELGLDADILRSIRTTKLKNGPHWFVGPKNAILYTAAGLELLRSILELPAETDLPNDFENKEPAAESEPTAKESPVAVIATRAAIELGLGAELTIVRVKVPNKDNVTAVVSKHPERGLQRLVVGAKRKKKMRVGMTVQARPVDVDVWQLV